MPCAGSEGDKAFAGWMLPEHMACLGFTLSSDCSTAADFDGLKHAAWGSFWRNCGSSLVHGCQWAQFTHLKRCVRPLLEFHAAFWPYTKQRAMNIDNLQAFMYRVMLRDAVPRNGDTKEYCHFGVICGLKVKAIGKWSERCRNKSLDWQKHVARSADISMVKRLLAFQDAAWLQSRRSVTGRARNSLLGG